MKTKYLQLLILAIVPILMTSQMLEFNINYIQKDIITLNYKFSDILESNLRFLEESLQNSQSTYQLKNTTKTSLEKISKSKIELNQDENIEITADIQLTENENEFNESISEEFNYTSHIWTLLVQIGEPNQAFVLELDTTISTTWVPSVSCKNCVTESKYNASESRTSRETNQTIKIEDYLGDLKGEVVYDDFYVNSLNISLRNFPFVQAIELNNKKYFDMPEGKLALSNVNKYGEKFSFLNALVKSGRIKNKIFALEFRNFYDDKIDEEQGSKDNNGKIYIGELPDRIRKLQRDQQFGLCNSTTSEDLEDEFRDGWTCEMTHLYFNNRNQLVNLTYAYEIQDARVIFDSSYEFIGLSRNFYDMFYYNYIKKNFKGMCRKSEKNKEIYFICNLDKQRFEQAESLFLVLQGYVLQLTASDLFVQLDNNHNYLFAIKFLKEDDDDDSKILLLGHLFLKNFITIFDAEKDQVSFYSELVYDITSDWNTWYNTDYYSLLVSRYFYLAVAACVLITLFLMFICFLVFRSFRRKGYSHGPLIENEIK